MRSKNISINHTLEEYNHKYSHLKYRLLKFSKKEVEEHDKKCPFKVEGYILKGRKWWLIKNTYYEVPRAPRYTWFKNLNGALQASICLLGIGAVTAAIVTPTVLLSPSKAKGDATPTIEGTGKDLIKSVSLNKQSDGSYNGKIELKEAAKVEEIEKISILVTENDLTKELVRDEEYTLNVSTGDIKINAGVIKTEKPKITVSVTKAEKTKKYTITAIAGQGGTVSPEEQEYVKGEQATVTATPEQDYRFEGWYEDGLKIEEAEATYNFEVTCKRTLTAKFELDTGELDIEGDEKVGVGDETPLECNDAIGNVTWDVADKNIATISKAGLVKGVSKGTTTITAVDSIGNHGSFEIEVLPYHAYLDFTIIEETQTCYVHRSYYKIPQSGEIDIPATVELDEGTFNVVEINYQAFYGSDDITKVTLPNTITQIDGQAFIGCSNLTSIEIPENVTLIGPNAFEGCDSLNSVKFDSDASWNFWNTSDFWDPEDHTDEENAFALTTTYKDEMWCRVEEVAAILKYVGFDENDEETEIEEDIKYYKVYCENKEECTYAEIPSVNPDDNKPVKGLYCDYNGAFQNCHLLKTVTFALPSNVKSIDYKSFYDCPRLSDITIPNSVTVIDYYAFADCKNLKSITLPNTLTEIDQECFINCTNLKSIRIPKKVTKIGYHAFNNSGIETAYFSDLTSSWDENGYKTFTPVNDDDELENGTNATELKNSEQPWFKNVPIEAEFTYTGYKIGEDGTEVEVDDDEAEYFKLKCTNVSSCEHALIPAYHPDYPTKPITGLLDEAFNWGNTLTSVEFEEGSTIKTFGNNAFSHCQYLTSIEMPETLTRIGEECFYQSGLTNITIPNNVDYIGKYCFYDCSNLTAVTLEEESKWNIVNEEESETIATYTAGTAAANADALTKMPEDGYCCYTWRKFGNREKFIKKLDEWVIGENGFNYSTTEYSTADISNVKIMGKDVENYEVAYYHDNSLGVRWFTIINDDATSERFDFGDPYYNSYMKSDDFLDDRDSTHIHYTFDENNNYMEYEVDEDYFDEPDAGTLRFLRVNKFGYIEKAIIYDDFGEGEKWNEFSVTYNSNGPHTFNNVEVESSGESTYTAVHTIEHDNYYKIKLDEGFLGYKYEFTINNSDGPIDLTSIIEDYVVKDYADENISFTLSDDKTKLTIIPTANTDINIRFKCKSNVENAKFKFVVIE